MSGSAGRRPGTSQSGASGAGGLRTPTSLQPSTASCAGGPGATWSWPTRVRLNSRWWRIEYVDKTHPEMEYDEEEQNWNLGTCSIPKRIIYIENSQSPSSMADTLVHEMAHACYSTAPLPGQAAPDEEEEEAAVRWFTETFFEIVKNAHSFWDVE